MEKNLSEAFRTLSDYIRKQSDLEAEVLRLTGDLAAARAKLAVANVGADDVWRWMGDGSDHPANLICPVVMSADTLRGFLSKVQELGKVTGENAELRSELETVKDQMAIECEAKHEHAARAEHLDKELSLLRPSVRKFAALMEIKLRENDHKGGWGDDDDESLLGRLEEELVELQRAIANKRGGRRVAREAADVANFAMMIADNSGGMEAEVKEKGLTAKQAVGVALSIPMSNTEMHECQRRAPGVIRHLDAMGWKLVPTESGK